VQPNDHPVLAAGNVCIVGSFIALQRGVWSFFGGKRPWRMHAGLVLAVVIATVVGLDPAYAPLRVAIVSASLALLAFSTAWDVQAETQRRLELRWGAVLAIPVLLAGLVFAFRAMAAVFPARDRRRGRCHRQLVQRRLRGAVPDRGARLPAHAGGARRVAVRRRAEERVALRRAHGPAQPARLRGGAGRRGAARAPHGEAVQRADARRRPLQGDQRPRRPRRGRPGSAASGMLLAAHMRDIDRVGRYGGEEFVVLLPGTTRSDALVTAERLREKVHGLPPRWQERTLRLTVSIGVAQWRGDEDDVASLLARADGALYQAKEAGRNCVAVAVG
jgi:hypothetical protein